MNAGLPLSEFTALLARQLADSAAMTDRRQRDEYVALAAEVDGGVESFVDRVVGWTDEERCASADRYLAEVIVPLLPPEERARCGVDEAVFRFEEQGRDILLGHFGELIRDLIELGTTRGTWTIERDKLARCILARLRRDAEKRFADVRALLRAGVPRTQIRGARLSAKVLLDDDRAGNVTARLASADAAKGCAEAISTLTVDFNFGVFPAFE